MTQQAKSVVESAGANAQYDEYAKKILSQKIFLAHILKGTIPEFKGMNPHDIIPLIEGNILVSKVPIEPGLTNQVLKSPREVITGNNTENSEPGEGKIFFDIIFYVRMKDGISQMIINIEAQTNDKPGYKLMNRATFYTSRMISSQKGRDFTHSNYDDIQSVYSIWICFNTSQNCLNHFHLMDDVLLGDYIWDGNRDLFNFVLIGLDKKYTQKMETYETDSELHHMLSIIFSKNLSGKEKAKLLDKELHISVNEETRKELDIMSSLSYGFFEQGVEQGAEQERKKVIQNMLMKRYDKKIIKDAINATDEEIAKIEKEMLVK